MDNKHRLDNVFVGREREIEQLTKQLAWVQKNNEVRLVFVHGEAGSGKTTLVKNFLKTVQKKNKVIIGWGICSLERQGNGLVPFATILDNINKQIVDWKVVSGSFADFIGKVAPAWLDLVTFGFASPTATTLVEGVKLLKSKKVNFTLDHVFIQFTNAVSQIAKQRLTVLIIEDLHWADKSSLELLFHVVRNLQDCSLLILATYRTEEAMQSSEYSADFRMIRANLIKDSNLVQEIQLTSGLDIKIYLQQRYKSLFLTDNLIARIQQETEGHAIYVAELFNLWEQTGVVIFDGSSWQLAVSDITIDLPPGFREVLQQRISNLNEQLREIITRASIEGDDFTIQTIAKLLEIEEYKMFDEIEILEKSYHLVSQKGSEKISRLIFDFYHFAHRFIQQHIYNGLSAGKRRLLHRQLGLCLEELCVDRYPVAAQLARHFHEANMIDKAISYAIQAARYEQNRYMWNEAQKWATRASLWLETLPSSNESILLRFQTKTTFGDSYYYQAKYIAAETYYQEAIALSKSIDVDPKHIANLYVNLADICDETSRFDNGYNFVLEGKKVLAEHDITSGETFFELIDSESIILARLGRVKDAYQTIRELISSIENDQSTEQLEKILGSAYHAQGIILSYMSNYVESIPSYLKAIEIFESIGYLSRQCFSLGAITEEYILTGQFERAKSSSAKAIIISKQIGDLSGESYGLYTQGLVSLELGDVQYAIQNFEKAIGLAEKTGSVPYYYYSDTALAYSYTSLDLALEYAVKGSTLASGREFSEAYASRVLGQVEAANQNWEKTIEYFELAIDIFNKNDDKHQLALAQKFFGEALIKMGKKKEAKELLWQAMKIFEEINVLHEIDNIKKILG